MDDHYPIMKMLGDKLGRAVVPKSPPKAFEVTEDVALPELNVTQGQIVVVGQKSFNVMDKEDFDKEYRYFRERKKKK